VRLGCSEDQGSRKMEVEVTEDCQHCAKSVFLRQYEWGNFCYIGVEPSLKDEECLYPLNLNKEELSENDARRIIEGESPAYKNILDRKLWQYNCPCCNTRVGQWHSTKTHLVFLPKNAKIVTPMQAESPYYGIREHEFHVCPNSKKLTIQEFIECGPHRFYKDENGTNCHEIEWYTIYVTDEIRKPNPMDYFDPFIMYEDRKTILPPILPHSQRKYPLSIWLHERKQKIYNYSYHCPSCNGIRELRGVPESVEVKEMNFKRAPLEGLEGGSE